MRTKTVTRTVITAATLSALIGVPALAAPASGPSGSIELMQPVAPSTVTAPNETESSTTAPRLKFGDNAEFITKVEGRVSAKADIYVTVVCRQGTTVVYQWSASRDFAFPLQDQAGQGLEWNGGDASCEAGLIYRVDQGKASTITVLATETFDVSAQLVA